MISTKKGFFFVVGHRSTDLKIGHREDINTNINKTKFVFYFFYFFFCSTKTKHSFSKNLKIRKMSIFDFSNFEIFRNTLFFVLVEFFSKNQKFQNQNLVLCIFVFMSSRWQIFKSADRLESGLRCLLTKKRTFFTKIENFHQTSLFRHQLRDPLV